MQTYHLIPHPDHPPSHVRSITARIDASDAHWTRLRWRIEGARKVKLPAFAGRVRADALWQTTCFEVFLMAPERVAGAYEEYNFSPSQAWAHYSFASYRGQPHNAPMARPPVAGWRGGSSDLALFDVAVAKASLLALPWQFGLSAVIEEECGAKSFWAIAHPPGKPDFHATACFAGRLEAPAIP